MSAPAPRPAAEREVRHGDPFYIHTPESLADERDLVLKHDDTFVVFDRHGDMRPIGLAEEGLYHLGTRHLSVLTLRLGGHRPLLLGSGVREDNGWVAVDLTNADISEGDVITIPRGTLHLSRIFVLWEGVLYERCTLRNYGVSSIRTSVARAFAADFVDLFEVRGTPRAARGRRLPAEIGDAAVTLGYVGLDDAMRRTRVTFSPPPREIAATDAWFDCVLPPQGELSHVVAYACEPPVPRPVVAFMEAAAAATSALHARRDQACTIDTSNHQFNDWIARSASDLAMMISDTPHGAYPYAGVPWFSTPFGRDGLITAFECLWMMPSLARGVLQFLAATQARDRRDDQDAQPGKILHEMRSGEMAALGEIPFGRYYGSHDATPLFVMLAEAYFTRTGDLACIRQLWPAIVAALDWMTHDGDPDGDGFLEYARQNDTGLVHQGWKDSHDSVHHASGELAAGPIALCEIQGYAYAAWRGAARLAALLGEDAAARDWDARAERLRQHIEAAFWVEALGTYALALDGHKRPCAVKSSNPGHLLWTGVPDPARALRVARQLVSPELFSGWGVRTLAADAARFNPMSYHNGSIWPHDNALVAAGCRRYDCRAELLQLMSAMFEASTHIELHRLPELFCGFPRRAGQGPTAYPVACNPQAWASASVFMLLQAALGLDVDAPARTLRFTRASLPPFLDLVVIRGLRIGTATIDVQLDRHEHDVGIHVLRREGEVQVVAIK